MAHRINFKCKSRKDLFLTIRAMLSDRWVVVKEVGEAQDGS